MFVVDARSALTFRNYALLADIGLCLESLQQKLSLYLRGEAILSSAHENINHIKQSADKWKMDIPFHALEHYASLIRSCRHSFMEKNGHMYEQVHPLSGKYKHLLSLVLRFMKDPAPLAEQRLLTSRR